MNRRFFRRAGCLILTLACLLWAASAGAEEVRPYIRDDADLLTDAEEEQLYQDMLPICEFGTPLFWTTTDYGDYEELAEQFYHSKLDLREDGVLFVINMYARQLTVFSDGAVYRVIPRGEAESITDNVFRLAGRGEYYECAKSAFEQIWRLLNGEQIARPMKLTGNLLLALVLALLGVYLYIRGRYENKPDISAGGAALPVTAAAAAAFAAHTANTKTVMTQRKKTNISSGSGSGGRGGSFGGGGGFSGGGSSGGGGSHGF